MGTDAQRVGEPGAPEEEKLEKASAAASGAAAVAVTVGEEGASKDPARTGMSVAFVFEAEEGAFISSLEFSEGPRGRGCSAWTVILRGAAGLSLPAAACSSKASGVRTTRLLNGPKKESAATNSPKLSILQKERIELF